MHMTLQRWAMRCSWNLRTNCKLHYRLKHDDEWKPAGSFSDMTVWLCRPDFIYTSFFSLHPMSCRALCREGWTQTTSRGFPHYFSPEWTGMQRCQCWRERRPETQTAKYEDMSPFLLSNCCSSHQHSAHIFHISWIKFFRLSAVRGAEVGKPALSHFSTTDSARFAYANWPLGAKHRCWTLFIYFARV